MVGSRSMKKPMTASEMGTKGGRVSSPAKTRAARRNARLSVLARRRRKLALDKAKRLA